MLLYRAQERKRKRIYRRLGTAHLQGMRLLVGVNAFTYTQTGSGREGRRGDPVYFKSLSYTRISTCQMEEALYL